MKDLCFWCGVNRCQTTHSAEIVRYQNKLHRKAVKLLREGHLLSNSSYYQIVANNALRDGKDHKKVIRSIERYRHKGLYEHMGDVSQKISAFLRKKGIYEEEEPQPD